MIPALFNVLIPAFPCAIITLMLEIANFDIIEVGDYYGEYFEMPPTDLKTASLERIGFDGTYFLYNLGAISLISIAFLLLTLIVWLLSRKQCCGKVSSDLSCYRKVNALALKKKPKFMWNVHIHMIAQSFLMLCLSVFIQSTDITFTWIG